MKNVIALGLILAAAPVGTHPHIFVNTGVRVVVDADNRLTHIQITWEYDELYSLLITEDFGVDADYDGVLTASDVTQLTGFDMNWIDGFNGDLVATMGGDALVLSGPSEPTATLQDGKIVTTHMRAVMGAPLLEDVVSIKPYDGTYYTAYEVGLPVVVDGREGCDVILNEPDIRGALAMTQAELAAIPEDMDLVEAGFGDIGVRFATDVRITCAAR